MLVSSLCLMYVWAGLTLPSYLNEPERRNFKVHWIQMYDLLRIHFINYTRTGTISRLVSCFRMICLVLNIFSVIFVLLLVVIFHFSTSIIVMKCYRLDWISIELGWVGKVMTQLFFLIKSHSDRRNYEITLLLSFLWISCMWCQFQLKKKH